MEKLIIYDNIEYMTYSGVSVDQAVKSVDGC